MTRENAVVVTGAASGIGRDLAVGFWEAGWRVVGVDLDDAGLARLAGELDDRFRTRVGDVADPRTHDGAALLIEPDAGVLCWINNAGYNVSGSVHEISRDQYERGIAVDLGGAFWGTASAVRLMLEYGGGSIVNITSTHALVGFPGHAAYATAKAGIIGLTRQVAAEFAGRGIRCNAIAPGLVRTPLAQLALEAADDPAALRASWDELCPVGRWGEPHDVTALALHLAAPQSAFMTGQVLVVDGGQTVLARGQ